MPMSSAKLSATGATLWLSTTTALVVIGLTIVIGRWMRHYNRRRVSCTVQVATTPSVRAHHMHAIRALVVSCFPDDFETSGGASDQEDILDVLAGFHDSADCEWLLAFDGALIGLAMVVAYHDSLYVSSLCVLPHRRRHGVGSYLMRSASAYANSRGLDWLSGSVACGPNQQQLVRLYTRLGGQVQADHALASQGALQPAQRLRAVSGTATSHGVPTPVAYGVGG